MHIVGDKHFAQWRDDVQVHEKFFTTPIFIIIINVQTDSKEPCHGPHTTSAPLWRLNKKIA